MSEICVLLASQTRQEEGHGEVQKGQGPSQQIGRQSQEEGALVLLRVAVPGGLQPPKILD